MRSTFPADAGASVVKIRPGSNYKDSIATEETEGTASLGALS